MAAARIDTAAVDAPAQPRTSGSAAAGACAWERIAARGWTAAPRAGTEDDLPWAGPPQSSNPDVGAGFTETRA